MQRYCLGLTHSVNQSFLCIFDEGLQSQGPIDTFVQKGRASHYCDFCSKVCQLISFLIVTFGAKVGHSPYWTNLKSESFFSELVGTFVQNGSAVNYGFNCIAVILRPQSMPSLLAE